MDLKRKLGLVSGSGQSYELIRSTQSLVDRLNLDSEDISIQPVHPSIMGQVMRMNHPMKVMKNTIGYSCKMKRERV